MPLTINLTGVASTSGDIGYIPYQVSSTKFGNSPFRVVNGSVYQGAYRVATLNDIPAGLTLAQVLANGNSVNETIIYSANGLCELDLLNSGIGLSYSDNLTNYGSISIDNISNVLEHNALINLTAPSVKKNGVEIATTGDLSSYITSATAAATYEPKFTKGTAFNKNFGTSSGDILLQTGTVASKILITDSNNKVTTASFGSGDIVLLDQPQTLTNKTISGYLTTATAASTYEPIITKGTAFNRNFGTTSGDILLLGSSTVASQLMATDANNQVQTLTTATYPSLTELSYVKGVTSAVQTQLDGKGYTVSSRFYAALSPTDGTTYYPVYVFASNVTAGGARSRHKVLKSGTKVNVGWTHSCSAGSNEGVTLYVTNVTTSTTITITSTIDMSASTANNSYLNNSLVYTSGDLIEVSFLCPSWATNPTALVFNVDLQFI